MPELLQENFTAPHVAECLNRWLRDSSARATAKAQLALTVNALRTEGESPFAAIVRILLGI